MAPRMAAVLTGVLLHLGVPSRAGNPLVPHVGMADPHVHFFEGQVYMYATHDTLEGNGTCCWGPWWVWRSDDLVTWENVSTLPDFPWEPAELHNAASRWATDAAERGGRYFWYVSVGGTDIAVVSGPTPIGPWSDPLGTFLLSEELGDSLRPPTNIRDPGVLRDDDGKYYIIFGACSGPVQPTDSCYYIAELNEDMVSYQPPRHVSVQSAMGPYGPGKTDDKPFLHKREDTYYLSWGCFYATSSDVYGPYLYQGSIIDPALVAPDFRIGNASQQPWYEQEIYADRHASFFFLHGQWYFFCNDRSHSDALGKFWEGGFRQTVAAYVHYYDNGTIAPIVIDEHGVGSHDAVARPLLPAENYFSIEGAVKREFPGGFKLVGLRHGSEVRYARVRNIPPDAVPWLRVANGGDCSGSVYIRAGTSTGPVVGLCSLPRTGSWEHQVDVPCGRETEVGQRDVALVLQFFGCQGQELAHLDHITFASTPVSWQ